MLNPLMTNGALSSNFINKAVPPPLLKLNNPPPLGKPNLSQFTPPEGGIMDLKDFNMSGKISQITQPDLIGKNYSEREVAPGIRTEYVSGPNIKTSTIEQQGLNLTNTEGLNTFVNNMINNRLKEFFSGIMSMLDV